MQHNIYLVGLKHISSILVYNFFTACISQQDFTKFHRHSCVHIGVYTKVCVYTKFSNEILDDLITGLLKVSSPLHPNYLVFGHSGSVWLVEWTGLRYFGQLHVDLLREYCYGVAAKSSNNHGPEVWNKSSKSWSGLVTIKIWCNKWVLRAYCVSWRHQ